MNRDGPSARGLIRATLQSGLAKCMVTCRASSGQETLAIEREVGAAPRVYQDGIEELVDRSVLHAIEIYSQGDLQRIAEDEKLRLELIDHPNKQLIESLTCQRSEIAKELRQLGPRIREKAAEIETRRADVRSLEALRSQLAELQSQRPQLSDELDAERAAALQRKSVLDGARKAIAGGSSMLSAVRQGLASGSEELALVEQLRGTAEPAASELADVLERQSSFRATVLRDLAALEEKDATPLLQALEAEFEKRNARYYQLRQEQQEVNDSLKREDNLKQQITHLEKLQRELDRFLEERQELLQRRQELRRQLQQIGDRIHELRQHEVDTINGRHSEVVILTLDHGTRSADYAKRLSALLQGSRLRAQEDVARDLAVNVRPCDLIDIVEGGDSQRLAKLLNRDLGQMARLVSFLMDRPELYELEGVVFEDQLEITMYDREAPKPINQLSKGQMATALLPLILRPAPYPLVFDQREDDLDNSFIYRTLVEQIQSLKQQRQLIFVTHNANIPVLGEADMVVVMEMDTPVQAKCPTAGSVDAVKSHILDLLEGGSEAFRRRQQKYDSLLA